MTDRLRLVPLSDDHLDYEVQLDSDPEVVRFLGNGRPRTRAEVEQLHSGRMARAKRVPGLGFWSGFLRTDLPEPVPSSKVGEFVGWWILQAPMRPDQGAVGGQAELGYRLMRKFWRRGLAKEGSRALMQHGFQNLGLSRIFAETMAVNVASRATMASVGMKYIRTFHEPFEEMIPGSDEGEVEYAITLEEWSALEEM